MLSLALLFVALVGGVLACGGGGSRVVVCPTDVTSGTTAGAYVISITGTSGAITQTGTVSLTVQ
jgi:trimeric autotransporter adhesin